MRVAQPSDSHARSARGNTERPEFQSRGVVSGARSKRVSEDYDIDMTLPAGERSSDRKLTSATAAHEAPHS